MTDSQVPLISPKVLPAARWVGEHLVAVVKGDVDLKNSPDLRQGLLVIIKDKLPKKLILDLTSVSYMDSSGIAVMVEMLRKLREHEFGGKVCLIHVQPRVRGLLEIARLDQIFMLAKDEAEALAK
jgi:anti-sigma B factor antagonist